MIEAYFVAALGRAGRKRLNLPSTTGISLERVLSIMEYYRCLQLIGALLIATVSLLYPTAASAFKSTFKLPCMLSYDGKPPISTHCVLSIDASQRAVVEMVSTANGRRFVIENHKADIDEWYLDHQRAVRVSDEPIACYENREVKLCF